MTDQRRSLPGANGEASNATRTADRNPTAESRQVSWWPCHEFLQAAITQANVGPLPYAGTPAWLELADGDPRKLLALAAAGEHHVLRVETAQEALADASRAVSAATEWPRIGRELHSRATLYAEWPWLRREPA